MEIGRKKRSVAASHEGHEVGEVVASALNPVLRERVELTAILLELPLTVVEVKAEDISIRFDLAKRFCSPLKDFLHDVIELVD